MVFFSSVTEMKKTNSCHLNRWVFLIWYCTVSCSQLCLTWISCEKEHFTLKKFHIWICIWISFFKARRHWTTSHKVNKEFTSCKYLLQACLSLEIQVSFRKINFMFRGCYVILLHLAFKKFMWSTTAYQ